jgi:hypothetical protein
MKYVSSKGREYFCPSTKVRGVADGSTAIMPRKIVSVIGKVGKWFYNYGISDPYK